MLSRSISSLSSDFFLFGGGLVCGLQLICLLLHRLVRRADRGLEDHVRTECEFLYLSLLSIGLTMIFINDIAKER